MIEVKLTLHDAIEMGMVAQLQQMIEVKRQQDGARRFAIPQHPQTADASAEDAADVREIEQVLEKGETPIPWEEAKVDLQQAANAAAPIPSDIEVARAITEYSQREGVPKARELIESFGVKNAMSVSDERRAEFIAKTAKQEA